MVLGAGVDATNGLLSEWLLRTGAVVLDDTAAVMETGEGAVKGAAPTAIGDMMLPC